MSGRSLAFGLCILFMCSAFIPISVGFNVKVSKIEQPSILGNGNTLYVGGSGPDNYKKNLILSLVNQKLIYLIFYKADVKRI